MAINANAANMAFVSLVSFDPVAGSKGQRTATIAHTDGQPALWTLKSGVKPLFAPNSFSGDANAKKSLCLTVPAEVMDEAVALDDWAVKYAQVHSERLFGKALTLDQIKERYVGVVRSHEKYPSYVKVKIATDLRNQPIYWTPEKTKRGPPEEWLNCELMCQFKIVSFWFMSSQFGLSVQLANAQVTEELMQVCPF
jgi:hypothetical protein